MPRLRSRTSTAESGSRLQTAPEPIESARIVAIGGIHRHKRNRKKSAQEPLTGGPAQTRSRIAAIESARKSPVRRAFERRAVKLGLVREKLTRSDAAAARIFDLGKRSSIYSESVLG